MGKTREGFTLIEILVVVAIIAILSSVVLVGLGPARKAGRDSRRVADLRQVQNALELYFNKCGFYPGGSAGNGCPSTPQTGPGSWPTLQADLTGSGLGVNAIPNDPLPTQNYYYGINAGGTSYVLGATLEDSNNPVFQRYSPLSLVSYTGSLPSSCSAPVYCIQL